MPSSFARLRKSSTFQSSYEPDLPPFLPTEDRPPAAEAFAIRAAFSFDPPSSRIASYTLSSFTLGPGFFLPGMIVSSQLLDS